MTTLNIGAASLERSQRILDWVRERQDQVLILTETSVGTGTRNIVDGLKAMGYRVSEAPPEKDRGALVASKLEVRRTLTASLHVTLPWRVAAIELSVMPLVIIGVYVPSRDRSELKVAKKRDFIESLLTSIGQMPATMRRRVMLAGDYNVVSRSHLPRLSGYFEYEYQMLETLASLGFVGGHEIGVRHLQPHSWVGRTGIGYLYDYMHFAGGIQSKVTSCAYEHHTRAIGLSDHAAVSATIAAA